jgi:hypothetical protein
MLVGKKGCDCMGMITKKYRELDGDIWFHGYTIATELNRVE